MKLTNKQVSYNQIPLTTFINNDTLIYGGVEEPIEFDKVMELAGEATMENLKDKYAFLQEIDFREEYKMAILNRIYANPILDVLISKNPQ